MRKEKVLKLKKALDDFNAALAYKKPVHAKEETGPQIRDGGTRTYYGDGYELTISKSLFSIGADDKGLGVEGYMYGPTLTFKRELGVGNLDRVSRVSFYPRDTLSKFMK